MLGEIKPTKLRIFASTLCVGDIKPTKGDLAPNRGPGRDRINQVFDWGDIKPTNFQITELLCGNAWRTGLARSLGCWSLGVTLC